MLCYIVFNIERLDYIYNTPDLKFYLGAGIVIDWTKYANVAYLLVDSTTGASTTFNPGGFNGFNTFVMFKTGFKVGKKWAVFADYQTPGNLTNNTYFSGNFTSVQLGLNYYFN